MCAGPHQIIMGRYAKTPWPESDSPETMAVPPFPTMSNHDAQAPMVAARHRRKANVIRQS
jgi:hypothetical protein